METPECFVCYHSAPPLRRVCRCNTVVHPECFRALVQVPAHRTHCAVCQQAYPRPSRCGRTAASVLAGTITVLVGASQWWVASSSDGTSALVLLTHLTGGVCVVLTLLTCLVFVRADG